MFATGMTCSHEQLVMDEETSAMSRRIARGLEINDRTIAADLIQQVGPKGDYLTCEHTLANLRSGEYLTPRVSVRGPLSMWQAQGSPDTYELAKRKVREYAAMGPAVPPLDAKRAARLAEIIKAF
jgi:trimethylamine--corrinoid protein Co-methyltransferase